MMGLKVNHVSKRSLWWFPFLNASFVCAYVQFSAHGIGFYNDLICFERPNWLSHTPSFSGAFYYLHGERIQWLTENFGNWQNRCESFAMSILGELLKV